MPTTASTRILRLRFWHESSADIFFITKIFLKQHFIANRTCIVPYPTPVLYPTLKFTSNFYTLTCKDDTSFLSSLTRTAIHTDMYVCNRPHETLHR